MPVHEFEVKMTCSGCSGAVTRVLTKLQGVTKVDCNLDTQRVLVDSTLPSDDLLASIKKTGKECSYIGEAK